MTEVCGATNCIMMEVGGATGSMMKCVELNGIFRGKNYCIRMNEVCGAISHKMDQLIVRRHQVDGPSV